MIPSRPLFGIERVWLTADRLWPPFVNQLVVEGAGDLDATRWRAAVETILPAWPGARARLRGTLGWTRWVGDGAPPAVVEVDGAGWDARGPAPFTGRRLDPEEGPIVEALLVAGAPPRVVLRTHHAAFDGRAAWALAEDLGAALRGEPIRGAAFADLSDVALVDGLGSRGSRRAPAADATFPTGPATTADESVTWARVTLPRSGGNVLPRAIVALADASRTFQPDGRGLLRVSLPVDLRRHHDGLRAAANLTGFVRVELPTDAPGSPEAVGAAIAAALERRDEIDVIRATHPLRFVPLAAMVAAGGADARAALRRGRASNSAAISNLGRLDPNVLDHKGFRGHGLFWIPPGNLGNPLFVTLTGHPGGIELCGAMPDALADDGRLARLLTTMSAGMAAK